MIIKPEWLVGFLRDRVRHMALWDYDTTLRWLDWHFENGLVAAFIDEQGIRAVLVGRRVESLEQANAPLATSEHGDCLYISEFAKIGQLPLSEVIDEGMKLWPWCSRFMYVRRGGRVKEFALGRISRTLAYNDRRVLRHG